MVRHPGGWEHRWLITNRLLFGMPHPSGAILNILDLAQITNDYATPRVALETIIKSIHFVIFIVR